MKGYKMVKENYTDFYSGTVSYVVGQVVKIDDYDIPEVGSCGRGLHVSREPHGPLQYNATYPLRLLEVSYDENDVLGMDDNKVRVKRLKVIKELHPYRDLGFPNADKLEEIIKRCRKIKMKSQTNYRKRKIRALVREHVGALNKFDKNRRIVLKKIKFYTIEEWASVWASVWDSVWASVWDSVRDSVWDSVRASVWASVRASVWDSVWASVRASVRDSVRASVWDSVWASVRDSVWASVWDSVVQKHVDMTEPLFRILEYGGSLYGIDDEGIAHVIMPAKTETEEE